MKSFSIKYMLIAAAASSLFRGVFGLRDVIVPVELSFGLGPISFAMGVQDLLVGIVAGFIGGQGLAANSAASQSGENPEADLVRRYEQTYRVYRNCGLLVFGLSLLGGGYIIANGIQTAMAGYRSGDWQRVEGAITESKVSFTSRTERHESDSSRPEQTVTRTHETFFPNIKYEYEVDDRKWEGTRITTSDAGMTSGEASAQAKKFPEGSKVTIYYNPLSPAESVLIPGITTTSMMAIAAGSLWSLFCVLAITFLVLSNFARRMILEFVKPAGVHLSDSRVIHADRDESQ